mmetsp:Transcript_54082/g.126364  ORF Transcript_54082/g.126364 Transcript_54082/m.126364 type:complete len:218 (-) Transcript_54082:301-954(-)
MQAAAAAMTALRRLPDRTRTGYAGSAPAAACVLEALHRQPLEDLRPASDARLGWWCWRVLAERSLGSQIASAPGGNAAALPLPYGAAPCAQRRSTRALERGDGAGMRAKQMSVELEKTLLETTMEDAAGPCGRSEGVVLREAAELVELLQPTRKRRLALLATVLGERRGEGRTPWTAPATVARLGGGGACAWKASAECGCAGRWWQRASRWEARSRH